MDKKGGIKMIIDGCVKVGPSFDRKGKLVEEYLIEMDKNKIDKAVLCGNRPASYSYEEGNEYVAKAMKVYPDKFFGAVRVDPWNWDKSRKVADKYIDNHSFQFIYLNPWEDNYRCNDQIAHAVYSYAAEKRIPIIIETGYPFVSNITQVGEMANKFNDTVFITTNAGQIDLSGFSLSDVGYMLGRYKNIYLGTGAAVGAEWLANQIENAAKGRVLFQSSYPFFDVYMEKYRITHAYVSDELKDAVLGANILALISS
jgi:predicted TIM-barrel fold metal-dependent hydrolase